MGTLTILALLGPESVSLPTAVAISLVSALLGSGGIYAILKSGPERRKIVVSTSQDAFIIQSGVLKDLKAQYDSVSEELSLLKMENVEIKSQHADCRSEIVDLRTSTVLMQRDLDRHGKMTFISRRKTHLAVHTLGNYELLIEQIFDDLRETPMPIRPEWRPTSVRSKFQEEMDKLEEMEAKLLEQTINNDSSDALLSDEPTI